MEWIGRIGLLLLVLALCFVPLEKWSEEVSYSVWQLGWPLTIARWYQHPDVSQFSYVGLACDLLFVAVLTAALLPASWIRGRLPALSPAIFNILAFFIFVAALVGTLWIWPSMRKRYWMSLQERAVCKSIEFEQRPASIVEWIGAQWSKDVASEPYSIHLEGADGSDLSRMQADFVEMLTLENCRLDEEAWGRLQDWPVLTRLHAPNTTMTQQNVQQLLNLPLSTCEVSVNAMPRVETVEQLSFYSLILRVDQQVEEIRIPPHVNLLEVRVDPEVVRELKLRGGEQSELKFAPTQADSLNYVISAEVYPTVKVTLAEMPELVVLEADSVPINLTPVSLRKLTSLGSPYGSFHVAKCDLVLQQPLEFLHLQVAGDNVDNIQIEVGSVAQEPTSGLVSRIVGTKSAKSLRRMDGDVMRRLLDRLGPAMPKDNLVLRNVEMTASLSQWLGDHGLTYTIENVNVPEDLLDD